MYSNRPSEVQLEAFARELDELRHEVMSDVGQRDADHIRRVIRTQRYAELAGRGLIFAGILNPLAWVAGVASLGVSKILENMEIGHNVMHGQYDWMNDPALHSQSYEWDALPDADGWRRTHNFEHHTYTNIVGKDRDYGYTILRVSEEQRWHPIYRYQLLSFGVLMLAFDFGVGLHGLEMEKVRRDKAARRRRWGDIRRFARKILRTGGKDYLVFPLLAGPYFLTVLAGNFAANLVRNLWASMIIFCGHFTEHTQNFQRSECENESRGQWYYRQALGSSNIRGGRLLHLMTGHLSYQIEHHLFPDMPSSRYQEVAPRVQEIFRKYGVPYNTGSLATQFGGVLRRLVRYSRPPRNDGALAVA